MHLSIKRHDKAAVHDWRHLQRIKNELVGPEREAIELYPRESRLMDSANSYHLYVLPEGKQIDCGWQERLVVTGDDVYRPGHPRQRPWPEGQEPADVKTYAEVQQMLAGADEE